MDMKYTAILELIEDTIYTKIIDREKAIVDITTLLDKWRDEGTMIPMKGGGMYPILVDFSDLKDTLKTMGMVD